MSGIVTLTTDFGARDGYVASMKGVILSLAPGTQIIDITHDVGPQAVLSGAFVFESAWRYFPHGTVHVVVVDPGVGTARRRIAAAAGGHYFVGPDNGCLSALLPSASRGRREPGAGYRALAVEVPDGLITVAIENEAVFRGPVSATFEGRDVFAPAAAHLARGGDIEKLGPLVASMAAFPAFRAPSGPRGLDGRVVHVDRFGNLITDIEAGDLAPGATFRAGSRTISLSQTYGTASGLSAIVGSFGTVEIAMPNGSAAQVLGLGPGDRVVALSA